MTERESPPLSPEQRRMLDEVSTDLNLLQQLVDGDAETAIRIFKEYPIGGLDNMTAEDAIKAGRGAEVIAGHKRVLEEDGESWT